MPLQDEHKSLYSIPSQGIVYCVEFSPFPWSSNLIAVATASAVTVYSCVFEEEDSDVDGMNCTQIRSWETDAQTNILAWSPETSLSALPKCVSFVTAEIGRKDHALKLISSDLKQNDHIQYLEGHTDFVNSLTFDPSEASQLASTGDDLTCRVWNKDGSVHATFNLTSPGMTVCWHKLEPLKILVAQKNGVICIFSLHNQRPIMSLNTGQVPLMCADWSFHDSLIVGAVAGSDWLVFNTSMSSRPIEKRQAHTDGCREFRWARCHEDLLVTVGRPARQIKVFNLIHQQLHLNTSLCVANGVSWHLHLPIVAVGGDKNVHMWSIEST